MRFENADPDIGLAVRLGWSGSIYSKISADPKHCPELKTTMLIIFQSVHVKESYS